VVNDSAKCLADQVLDDCSYDLGIRFIGKSEKPGSGYIKE
jgi:hypothetical protein